jgi:hypothetical protein
MPTLSRKSFAILLGAALSLGIFLPSSSSLRAEKLFDKNAKRQLTAYLLEICQWILDSPPDAESRQKKDWNGSILINAYFVRALLAGAEYSKDPAALTETALRWCDAFARKQTLIPTAKGNVGGYWIDPASGTEFDLSAQAGAALALTRAASLAEGSRTKVYLQALENYVRLVQEGTRECPLKKGEPGVPGWVVSTGEEQGAVGFGYLGGRPAMKASTSSTAMHVSLFARLGQLTKNPQYKNLAMGGFHWLVKSRRPNGETIFWQEGEENDERLFLAAGLQSEAILAIGHVFPDDPLTRKLNQDLPRTLRWLVDSQGDKGIWGEGEDRLGSPGIANLFYWDFQFGSKSQQAPAVLDRYWQTITNPVHRQSYGIMVHGLPTGLVALSVAETIKPGSMYR